jgi:threonine synthase
MVAYISTRGGGRPQSFEQVVLQGLAPDGGLYVPMSWPRLDMTALEGASYQEVAFAVMAPYVGADLSDDELRDLIAATYNTDVFRHPDITPLRCLSDGLEVLELFHGPTIAFKDVALQFLGRLFDVFLARRDAHITILGATSGDTGSAAIEGCRHSARARIFILHPKDRVSDVQRRQMTTVSAPHVHNIAIEGTFDDCQALVKAAFRDEKFRAAQQLSAVNSINWARIMAQIVYYVYAALALGANRGQRIIFVVPTGNFGNVFAAYAARQMGVPIHTLALATNQNDILTRYFETGVMDTKTVQPSLSPSMDIQISSNFERYLFDVVGRNSDTLKTLMEGFERRGHMAIDCPDPAFQAYRTSEDETIETIRSVYNKDDYLIDPHTAVGVHAAYQLMAQGQHDKVVALACAHPAKFPAAVQRATGVHPPLPAHLADLFDRPEFMDVLPADLSALKQFIES